VQVLITKIAAFVADVILFRYQVWIKFVVVYVNGFWIWRYVFFGIITVNHIHIQALGISDLANCLLFRKY